MRTRSRIAALSIGTALAVVGSVGASPLAASAAASQSAFAGVITDSRGAVVPNAQVVLLVTASDGAGVHSKQLAATRTDKTGQYSFSRPAAADLADIASLNGGQANWEIDASWNDGSNLQFASTVFPDQAKGTPGDGRAAGSATADTASTPSSVDLKLNVVNATPKAGSAIQGPAASGGVTPNVPVCSTYWVNTGATNNYWGLIGEPHANWDITVDYTYQTNSSSTLGLAVNYNGNGWSASGTASVNNSSSSSFNSGNKGPYWANYVMGQFQYIQQQLANSCSGALNSYRWYPGRWTGGVSYGADTRQFDGYSSLYYQAVNNGWDIVVPDSSTFSRTTGSGASYSAGVNLGFISVSSQTDYSSSTTYTWHMGSGNGIYTHELFGGDGAPTWARIVYSN
jgi:hypothetical protein